MTTMNRFNHQNVNKYTVARLELHELGFGFVHSSLDKQKRGNCVFDTGSRN